MWFTQPEKTTYKCDKCEKSSNDATKQFSIRKLPPVLCFQLKRFEVGAASSNKIDHVVRFGATLNMAPFSSVVARKGINKDPGPDSMYEIEDQAMQDLKDSIHAISTEINDNPQAFDAHETLGTILKMLEDYAKQHADDIDTHRDTGTKRDTPGVETFFWHLWARMLNDLGRCESEHDQETNEDVKRAIAFLKAMQELPEGEYVWTLWGEDVDVRSLPLLGPGVRDANNGPFYYTGPSDAEIARPEVQNTLAGAGTGGHTDESVTVSLKRRKEWLGLQALISKLLSEVGLEECAVHGIWAARDGLEDWPSEPPAIIIEQPSGKPPSGEDTAGYRALMVEGATTWLRLAAPQLYACTKIWGPNGNPEWKSNAGAPGRGGARWKGVDGMDPDKKRWALWKDILREVIAWYDKEASAGRGEDWKVKESALKALDAMTAAEGK
ncbi:hypothetical protein FRC11_010697 [Ceratobasidium sp. 423]|nr:hypothetical protein FRC11_010697 [Ceratobasidium sp. 423]